MKIFGRKGCHFLPGKLVLFLAFLMLAAFSTGCTQKQDKLPAPDKTGMNTPAITPVETVTPGPEISTSPGKSGTPEEPGKSEKPAEGSKKPEKSHANPYEPPPEAKSAAPAGMLTPENLMMPLKTGFELQRAQAQFLQCQSNEKNIGTALEMYYTDHGRFPGSISELSPEYLITLPKCAASNGDTYSDSYVTNSNKNAYFFCCKGEFHKDMGAPANFPRYDSKEGLLLPVGYEETLSPEMKLFRCESNLRSISNAIEMYSTDHHGKYPERLEELVPDYIPRIPQCPAAGKDTYTSSYSLNKDASGEYYSLFCSGNNHVAAGLGRNFPRFEYKLGTVKEKPGLTEEDKKRIEQREAMKLLGDAMTASYKKDNKKARIILEKVKKMNVLNDKFTKEQIDILEKRIEIGE